MDDRAVLLRGKQRAFIQQCVSNSGKSLGALASELHVCGRTLRDWRREKYSISKPALQLLSREYHVPIPAGTRFKRAYHHTPRAGRLGWNVIVTRYGKMPRDPLAQRQGWLRWWNNLSEAEKADHLPQYLARDIAIPDKDESLAELIGIILGDGSVSRFQVCISLGSETDYAYVPIVAKLIKNAFDVNASIYRNQNVLNIVVSRRNIVKFLLGQGLVLGDKVRQQVGVPTWIQNNKKSALACVRGLMDTDGCIFQETHFYKTKSYSYPRLSFVNHSAPLREFVFAVLRKAGIMARFRNNRAVTVERREDVVKYKLIVGFSNPKHDLRYRRFLGGVA
ncbi:MAG: hypothetical protein Q8P33_03445 [bacterium]|nr:hypothetical protein [bacterium]